MSDLQQDCVCENSGLGNAVKAMLEIGERRQAGLLVLTPVGRIDNLTSAEFRTRLLGAVTSGSADVVVDFSGVEYISSCGLHTLMTASRQKSKERRLAVVCLNAVVQEIFTISRCLRSSIRNARIVPARSTCCIPSRRVANEPQSSSRVERTPI